MIFLGSTAESIEKYQSAVVNYMPALKWLLVVMDHQRRLEEDHEKKRRFEHGNKRRGEDSHTKKRRNKIHHVRKRN